MGLEAGVTKLSDLDPTWPLSTDLRHYGDDHLRNIKIAAKSLLPGGVTEQLSHADLLLRGTNTHAQIDTHISNGAFVDRGDPVDYDKTVGDFVKDAAWHDWDLSAIVPSGARAVLIRLVGEASSAGTCMRLRKDGNAYSTNSAYLYASAANITYGGDYIVPCSAGRVIEYYVANANWTALNALVAGWFF